MTTTFTAQPRRQAPSAPRRPRELPVLFHLLDVSRPRGYAKEPAVAAGHSQAAEPPAFSESAASAWPPEELAPQASATLAAAKFDDILTEMPPAEAIHAGQTPLEQSAAASEAPAAAEIEPVAFEEIGEHAEITQEEQASQPGSILESAPPANPDDAVALRQRAEERKRKRLAAAKDDWFTSHGKFIAIGFVLALLATIFLARRHRQPIGPPIATRQPHSHQSEHSHSPPKAVRSASAERAITSKSPSAASPAVAIKSISPTQTSTGASQTALHPPTIPQLPAQAAAGGPTDDNLFPWGKREDERVAMRADDLRSPAAASPAATPAPPLTPQAPAPKPQYPSTHYRGDYQPVATPALPPGGQPSYPTTNSASGYRYERTGSGFH